jgi:hypothetical protein
MSAQYQQVNEKVMAGIDPPSTTLCLDEAVPFEETRCHNECALNFGRKLSLG